MRRRSERKKSTEVSSPAPTSRRSNRRRKSLSQSESEKNVEAAPELLSQNDNTENDGNVSVEDITESALKIRGNRTPVSERLSPNKRKNKQTEEISELNISTIPEEENGCSTNTEEDKSVFNTTNKNKEDERNEEALEEIAENLIIPTKEVKKKLASSSPQRRGSIEDKTKSSDVLEIQIENENKETQEEIQADSKEKVVAMSENAGAEKKTVTDKITDKTPTEEIIQKTNLFGTKNMDNSTKLESVMQDSKHAATNLVDHARIRKRKWLSKKVCENKAPILSISTDSLKNLIADVHPVPLSDVKLESSSEVEEIVSEREEGEETPTPDRECRRPSIEKVQNSVMKRIQNDVSVTPGDFKLVQRSPSPARNHASNVLFITNLVRPFTVLQLKGLLARTGKIVENGFWIDRIKSKCYVQYETADEAIETRHALHGVRWPVSNPKCLNVDFGIKSDMERAIQSSKDEAPKFGHDNIKDNQVVGTGWNRDRNEEDKKQAPRHVREWDVGKKENLDRDKNRNTNKRRSSDRDVGNRENDKERKNRAKGREQTSNSLSPVRKIKKKENDPPLRLLDDLFRKTKATPCIYWLPLTPEQIAEKEEFRQKRIEEHKQRIKQRELERVKEREKERSRASDRDKEKEIRRNRSSDRRRSRSRDRRRY